MYKGKLRVARSVKMTWHDQDLISLQGVAKSKSPLDYETELPSFFLIVDSAIDLFISIPENEPTSQSLAWILNKDKHECLGTALVFELLTGELLPTI